MKRREVAPTITPRILFTRRQFVNSGILLAGSLSSGSFFEGCKEGPELPYPDDPSPSFFLTRDEDEVFLRFKPRGYHLVRHKGDYFLEKLSTFRDPLLIYEFPPQQFAETAVAAAALPKVLPETVLSKIAIYPSNTSSLVFRDSTRQRIPFSLIDLLNWSSLELVLPDLDKIGAAYDLGVAVPDESPFSLVEMPWGIYLTPVQQSVAPQISIPRHFRWDHALTPRTDNGWSELWSTGLQQGPNFASPKPFELLGLRGFQRASTNTTSNPIIVTYQDSLEDPVPDWLGCDIPSGGTTSLCNQDRIELAASLSRRFKEKADSGKSVSIAYDSAHNPDHNSFKACFVDGRTIAVKDFRLSPRGGYLDLDTRWPVEAGCSLEGWKHSTYDGRDQEDQILEAGFLFPFGIKATLVVRTERAFIPDEAGHFIAPLIKQAFLEIPDDNAIQLDHKETPFTSLQITTKRTPPLDLPQSGDPGDYERYDFFLPLVDGEPFPFEHSGIDWAGTSHSALMPMFFVSNRAVTAENGLIWETGDSWNPGRVASTNHAIPTAGLGLRVVDAAWNSLPHRFAQYGDSAIALSQPLTNGDTSLAVRWVEWTRSQRSQPSDGTIAARPFQPRARSVKAQMQGMNSFSGETKWSLATYRDTRFTKYPVLDPEPNAPPSLYFLNLPVDAEDPTTPYLYLLETRALIGEAGSPVPEDEPSRRNRIKRTYYGLAGEADAIPDLFFDGIDNEICFGVSGSTESTGGLSVPDTHVSTLTRRHGPVGDSTFDLKCWTGYASVKARLASGSRLDYAAYRLTYRSQIDIQPFDNLRQDSDLDSLQASAATVMGFPQIRSLTAEVRRHLVTAASPSVGGQLNLADLFGADAQLIPGLSFRSLFQDVLMRDASQERLAQVPSPGGKSQAADPLTWNFKITGIDWLLQLLGSGPGQFSFSNLLDIAAKQGQSANTAPAVSLGIDATLDWSNESFNEVTLGPIVFTPIPQKTKMTIGARSHLSLGANGLSGDLSSLKIEPGNAEISSNATISDFIVTVFEAVEIEFSSVSFSVASDGHKAFLTQIRDVRLKGVLDFINQLSQLLGGLGSDLGIQISISPARVTIGQTLRFPKNEGDPLFIGPAQIINLALSWGVMIPLIGRDVITLSFALASRDKPLTIFVPPWYGGKAHFLLEVTTRGIRLLEVSMEYGALIPIHWGIAKGDASLTAGVFYSVERTPDQTSGKVVFTAFVKASANLDIAGIIKFFGLISISLSFVAQNGRRLIIGEAAVSVSIKIGFVRISYGFTATHVEESGGSSGNPSVASLELPAFFGPSSTKTLPGYDVATDCASTMPPGVPGDTELFSAKLNAAQKSAFSAILSGYVDQGSR